MQDSVSSMILDFVVNGVNILASIVLAAGIGRWHGLGFTGIAAGTVLAQYSGLATSSVIIAIKYKDVFAGYRLAEAVASLWDSDTRRFMTMNRNLFIRSVCFIAIYIGYTVISAQYGDLLLASASIMMRLLMIFSYFTDGFAYAAEAMTGKYIGARDSDGLKSTILWVFVWSISIAVLFIGIYYIGGTWMLRIMTSDAAVVECGRQFLLWLLFMPLLGVVAFTWDGIYIGATASVQIRNAMLWSVAAFLAVWLTGLPVLRNSGLDSGENCIHLLMGAYFAHLVARSVYLTITFRKTTFI